MSGLTSESMQRKLLSQKDLTFRQACEIASSMELASRNTLEIAGKTKDLQSVNAVNEAKLFQRRGKGKFKGRDDSEKGKYQKREQRPEESYKCYRCAGNSAIWLLDFTFSLNVSKTKELIVDFRKRHLLPYTPLVISGTPVERVSSFKYLGVNISEDLTWTTHIQTQVKKARQRLYHLRQLRKFRVSPTILKTFYAGTIESVLTQCISVWYGNSSSQDCKALQRVVRLAERISGSALPSLQDIYLKRCRSRAVKIIKDSNHPGNCLFTLLPSGKRFRSLMAKTERLRRSFFPKAIRLLNSNSAS